MTSLLPISCLSGKFEEECASIAREIGFDILDTVNWTELTVNHIVALEPDLIVLDGRAYANQAFDICRMLKYHRHTRIIPLLIIWSEIPAGYPASLIEAGADIVASGEDKKSILNQTKVLIRSRSYTRHFRNNYTNLIQSIKQLRHQYLQANKDNQKLMDVSEAIVITLSSEGLIQKVNQKALEILGEEEEAIIGRHWIKTYVVSEKRTLVESIFDRLGHENQECQLELEHSILTQERGECVLLCRYSLREDIYGNPAGLILSAQDITLAKRIENALYDSEGRYESMARISPVGIFRVDPTGHYIYFNERWKAITGLDQEVAWEKYWIDTVCEPDRDEVQKNWRAFVQGEKAFSMEFRLCDLPNQEIWVNCHLVAEKDKKGLVTGYLGTITDISERKKAEKMLRNYENTVESTEDMLIALDQDYRFLIANQAFLRYFNLRKEAVIGNRAGETLEEGFFDKNMKPNLDLCLKGKFIQYERPLTLPHAGKRFVSESMFPLTDQSGEVCGIVASIRDITDRKTVEKQLLDYQSQLKKLSTKLSLSEERERRQIAVELHDRISQTLVFAKMKVDLLQDKPLVGKDRKALQEVADLIHETLDNVHRLTHELSYPILYEMGFEAAVSAWVADHIEKKHKLPVDICDDGNPKPLSDEVRLILFRAARELLNNVVKHARAHRVRIVIQRVGHQIELIVEDDGIGFGGYDRNVNPELGSGFGLFDIRERLEQVKGNIVIKSNPGEGTKVIVRAPLKGYTDKLEERAVYGQAEKRTSDLH